MSRFVILLLAVVTLVVISLVMRAGCSRPAAPTPPTAAPEQDDSQPDPAAEAKAVAFVEKLGGTVTRDETRPGKPVITVSLSGTEVTDAGLKELAPLTNLTTLNLSLTQVTDAGLKELAPLKNLTYLSLQTVTDRTLVVLREINLLHALYLATAADGKRPAKPEDVTTFSLNDTPVTGEGLKELAPLKKLTTLYQNNYMVTDRTLAVLREINLLHALSLANHGNWKRPAKPDDVTTLTLRGTAVTDVGLKELAALKNLTYLNLEGTQVTDAGLKELAPLKNLTTLKLGETKVTDAGLKELAPLKNLTTLDLSNYMVTDRTLAVLREISLLHALREATAADGKRPAKPEDVTTFSLNDTPVTGEGLKELAPLKKLTTLYQNNYMVTDRTLAVLREINLLHALSLANHGNWKRPAKPDDVTTLTLRGTAVTDVGLKELAALKNLTYLNLEGTQVTDAGLKELAPLKNLTTLSLPYGVTDAGLKDLAALKNLTTLNLNSTQVTDTGFKELAALKNLTTLHLRDTKVTDAGVKELAALKNLTTLDLSYTKVTDAGLKELAPLKNLTTLSLPRGVTDAGVKELQVVLPKCKITK